VKRAELVEKNHPKLSVREQCKILTVTRSTLSYRPVEESEEDMRITRIMDEIYLEDPCVGSRRESTDRCYSMQVSGCSDRSNVRCSTRF